MITAAEARAVTANGSIGVESPVLTAFLAVFAEEAFFFDVVEVGFLLFWSEGVTFSVAGILFLIILRVLGSICVNDNSAFTGDIAILSGGDSAI